MPPGPYVSYLCLKEIARPLEKLLVLSSCEGVAESVYTALNLFAKSHKDTSSLSVNINLTV